MISFVHQVLVIEFDMNIVKSEVTVCGGKCSGSAAGSIVGERSLSK